MRSAGECYALSLPAIQLRAMGLLAIRTDAVTELDALIVLAIADVLPRALLGLELLAEAADLEDAA